MPETNEVTASRPGFERTLRFIWPYARQHKKIIAGSFLSLFAGIGLRTIEPWPLKIIFDQIIVVGGKGKTVVPVFPELGTTELLGIAAGSLLIIASLRAAATYGNKVGFALVGSRVMAEVRARLFNHIQRLSLSFHDRAKNGDLILRMMSDIGRMREVTVTALMPLLASSLMLIAMAGMMIWINWKLAALVLLTLPMYGIPTLRLGRSIRTASNEQRKREGAMASTASEATAAIRTVKSLSLEGLFSESFSGQNRKSMKEGVRTRRLAVKLQGTVQFMIAGSTALVLFYGTRLVLVGALSAGELLVFLSYLKALFRPIQDIAKYTGRVAKATVASDRIIEIFEQKPEVADAPDAINAPCFRGAVEFEKVSFSYAGGDAVLTDVSVHVNAGEHITVVGQSGGGKSTLLNLLQRLYEPCSGRILIDGHDLRSFKLDSVRNQMAVVLQDNLLFAGTIRDNIAFGAGADSGPVTDAAIRRAARLANAHEFIDSFPDAYDTLVGERGQTLSTGQRQRIAIARAAVRDVPILILDEPIAAQDEENERAIIEALERLSTGRTTFLVTHDLTHAAHADRILFLREGRVEEFGTHEQLMDLNGRFASLYRLASSSPEKPQRSYHREAEALLDPLS